MTRMHVDLARRSFLSAIAMTVLVASGPARAASDKQPTRIGIAGYDPVAYFTEGRPVQGSSEFEYVWQNSRWYFASAAHRDMFRANPEHYAPQYAGYCAVGVGMGTKAKIDPTAWTIVDGKLYFTHDHKTLEDFHRDPQASIKQADENWLAMRD